MLTSAFSSGLKEALDRYGAPSTVNAVGGADRFTRALRDDPGFPQTRESYKPEHRLERTPVWGRRVSLEASSAHARTGLMPYAGV